MRMSTTLAVSTYSGGSPRIVWISVFPSLRSFLSCARLTRTSFALLRASIRWSSDRAGACACVLVGLMGRAILPTSRLASSGDFFLRFRAFCDSDRVFGRGNACFGAGGDELGANPRGRVRVREEDRA